MTTMTAGGRVPEFTLGWRLRLALETKGISVQEMADQLGYSRSTISRWLNDQDLPRAAVVAQWCLITEVDRDWLERGVHVPVPPDDPARDTTPALARLTEQKKARAGRSSATRRYLPRVLVPAVAA